jgi:microcompartment protein CcmK/EutM
MKLARVWGTVVSPICHPAFEGRKLLVCDLLDDRGEPSGGNLIAIDAVGAGAGETVLLIDEGNSGRQVAQVRRGPIRTVAVAIVDEISLES